jgi:hypothetical protein
LSVVLVQAPLLGADLEAALLARGASVDVHPAVDCGFDALQAAGARGRRAVVSINHSPELALLCSLAGLRYVSWTIDPLPRERWSLLGGTDLPSTCLFVHRKALVAPLRAMGYPCVEWLPLACAPRRWTDPVERSRNTRAPLFVGSSLRDERRILLGALGRWGIPGAAAVVDAMLADLSRACLWDRSFPGFARAPDALPSSLRVALPDVDPLEIAEVLDAGLAWRFRRELVAILAERGVEIKGDEGWREVAPARWTGLLRNGREMTSAYAGAAVSLDLPRFHQREIATLRAFDAMGSGGLLACETGTELDELFAPGRHFLSWANLAELEEILEASRRGDPVLAAIANAGQDAVRERHSLDDRARRILEAVAE